MSFGHGTANAHDEAAWLVLWGLGLPLDTDTTEHASALTPAQCQRLDALIAERITTRRPAAYITQEAFLADDNALEAELNMERVRDVLDNLNDPADPPLMPG